jgi:hypothetical protein
MEDEMPFRTAQSLAAGVALSLALVVPSPGRAEITKITVTSAKDIGPFGGKAYREVEAMMEGKAPGGPYAVPVTLAFPKSPADHSGVAVVDIVNTATIGRAQWVIGGRALPLTRIHMGDAFLFGGGRSYVALIWDKAAVEALKTGSIAAPADGYTIIGDAGELARNSARYMPDGPPPVKTVIAYGFSQTGELLRGWHADKYNTRSGRSIFDGSLVGGAGGSCRDLIVQKGKRCPGAVADGGKVIVFATETDVESGGFEERANRPGYRVIEVAGVSHIPPARRIFASPECPSRARSISVLRCALRSSRWKPGLKGRSRRRTS